MTFLTSRFMRELLLCKLMKAIHCKKHVLKLDHTLIIGILNVTPDSFSDGGRFLNPAAAIKHAQQMMADGADIIDVGGESTRPGSEPVPIKEELRRVAPVIKELVKLKILVSIDTMKPEVADTCLSLGASMLNDVTGLRNPEMIKVAAQHNVPTIIMHMLGTPKTMQANPHYRNVVDDVKRYLQTQAEKAKTAGIEQVILDPGIGFGKTVEHNLQLIKNIAALKELGYPIAVGPSRKSFIGKILNIDNPQDRLEGTLAAVTLCVLYGADIIRVHDVKECTRAIRIAEAIKRA